MESTFSFTIAKDLLELMGLSLQMQILLSQNDNLYEIDESGSWSSLENHSPGRSPKPALTSAAKFTEMKNVVDCIHFRLKTTMTSS